MTRRQGKGSAAWPMPLPTTLVPAIAIVAVVWFGLLNLFEMPVGWPRTSVAVHNQLLLAGPIATAAAHFYCANLAKRDGLLAVTSAPRCGHVALLRSFWLLLAWMLGAYLLAFIPLFAYMSVTATAGTIDVLAALSGPAGMALAVALGCALGTGFPYRVAAPAAGLLVFLLFQLPNVTTPSVAAFVPILGRTVTLGHTENPAFSVYRLIVIVTLTILVLAVASLLARQAPVREFASWRGAAAALIAAALVGIPVANPPTMVVAEQSVPRTCREVTGVPLCLHQGHERLLGTVAPVIRSLVEVYGGRPAYLDAIYGSELLETAGAPSAETTAKINLYTTGPVTSAVSFGMARYLAGQRACAAAVSDGRISVHEYRIRRAQRRPLQVWLRLTAGLADRRLPSSAAAPLSHASTPEVQAWIAQQQQALAHCQPLRWT